METFITSTEKPRGEIVNIHISDVSAIEASRLADYIDDQEDIEVMELRISPRIRHSAIICLVQTDNSRNAHEKINTMIANFEDSNCQQTIEHFDPSI